MAKQSLNKNYQGKKNSVRVQSVYSIYCKNLYTLYSMFCVRISHIIKCLPVRHLFICLYRLLWTIVQWGMRPKSGKFCPRLWTLLCQVKNRRMALHRWGSEVAPGQWPLTLHFLKIHLSHLLLGTPTIMCFCFHRRIIQGLPDQTPVT